MTESRTSGGDRQRSGANTGQYGSRQHPTTTLSVRQQSMHAGAPYYRQALYRGTLLTQPCDQGPPPQGMFVGGCWAAAAAARARRRLTTERARNATTATRLTPAALSTPTTSLMTNQACSARLALVWSTRIGIVMTWSAMSG